MLLVLWRSETSAGLPRGRCSAQQRWKERERERSGNDGGERERRIGCARGSEVGMSCFCDSGAGETASTPVGSQKCGGYQVGGYSHPGLKQRTADKRPESRASNGEGRELEAAAGEKALRNDNAMAASRPSFSQRAQASRHSCLLRLGPVW